MKDQANKPRRPLFPLKGAAIYALFGVLWIYFSDTLLGMLTDDPARLTTLQTYKGWFFILITAGLVFALLRRNGRKLDMYINDLKQSEANLDFLFQALPIGVGTAKDRILISANDRLCEMSGFTREELVGQATRNFYVDEAEYERVGKAIFEATGTGRAYLETQWKGKDGKIRNILFGTQTDVSGTSPMDFVFSAMDVTEQKEQQAMYRLVFESAHDALFLMDGPTFVDCNASALEIYGLEREQLVGTTPMDHSPPQQPDGQDSEQAALCRINDALAGKPQRFEWKHLRGDGTPFDAEISLNRIPMGGKPYLLVTNRDITERKNILEALRKSEDSLSTIFRTVPTGIAVTHDRVLVTVNEQFCEIFGYTRDELLGDSTSKLYVSEEEYLRCGKGIYNQLEELGVSSVECRMKRKSGQEIHVLIHSSSLASNDGEQSVISSILDITDRNKALQALKDNEEYLATVFRIAPTGIAVVKDRTFFTVNERFAEIFDYTPDELIGNSTRLIYSSDEEYLRYGKAYYESLERTGTCSLEVHGIRKNGEEIFLLVNASPLSRSGQEGLVTFSVLDITELKKTEQELRAHQEKLEEMVRERTAELTDSNAELQRLIAESESRSEQAAILNEMGELLQACETEEETYGVACGVCAKLFSDDAGCIGILEEDSWCIKIVGSWGEDHMCASEFSHNDCWAIRRGKAHMVLASDSAPLCGHVKEKPQCGTLCLPMNAQGRVLGMAHLRLDGNLESLGERERVTMVTNKRQLLSGMVERYAPSLVNLRLRETLREQSIRDRLTGLFNRRHMEEALYRELARARRRGSPLGVVMIDVDHFKRFNDTYGHETGDIVLRELGKFLMDNIRTEDIACRFGGEELLLILPDGSLKDTLARAEDIRQGIEQGVAASHGGDRLKVTASLGVAAFPVHGEDSETLLGAADAALYQAKKNGRNQVAGFGQ